MGNDRHHYRRVAFSARAEKAGDDCRFAAGRGQQYSGISPLACRVYAVDFQRQPGGPVLDIHQNDAENTMRELAAREGIFCGVSSGGAVSGRVTRRTSHTPGAIVVAIQDRGDVTVYRRVW